MASSKHVGLVAEKNSWGYDCRKSLTLPPNYLYAILVSRQFPAPPLLFQLNTSLPRYADRTCGPFCYLGRERVHDVIHYKHLIAVRAVPTRVCHFTRSPASESTPSGVLHCVVSGTESCRQASRVVINIILRLA
jgi:hypothetical protein